MAADLEALEKQVDKALADGRPADAACYLAEIVAKAPDDRHHRTALAIALGDAGHPTGALKVLRAQANRLAHDGYLLPAMIVIRQGLERATDDASLVSTLKRIHVRGTRAKAGKLPVPPPLKAKDAPEAMDADSLLQLEGQERLEKLTEIGVTFPPGGEAAIPLPMPLFSELDEDSFVETVKRLIYRRVDGGTELLTQGQTGDTLLVVASGHVNVEIDGKQLATLGPGSVIGEMAIITGAPRSATVKTREETEYFELSRAQVQDLAKAKPKVAEELVEYCRKRLIGNLLRTSPLFKKFDEATRYQLLDKFQRQGFAPGAPVIEQGSVGTGLYVLAAGEVEVAVDKDGSSTVVANLNPGDVFGEISLLKDQPTNATVRARGQAGVLFLPKDEFAKVLSEHPDVEKYLNELSDERIKASEAVSVDVEMLDEDDLIIL